jgi:DNA-binding transcriptional MerR regulator
MMALYILQSLEDQELSSSDWYIMVSVRNDQDARRFRIGELASATGTKVNTIRFYEEIGVLTVPVRTSSGRRSYDVSDFDRLRFVRRARNLGFTLDEIRSLLLLSDKPEQDCDEANSISLRHLQTVETKIERLLQLRDELTRISRVCAGGQVAGCRVLEALGSEEPLE